MVEGGKAADMPRTRPSFAVAPGYISVCELGFGSLVKLTARAELKFDADRLMPGRPTLFIASALIALAFCSAEASAQERRVPSSPNELRLSYAPVVQRAAPAVVNVYAAKTVTVRNPLFDDPIFRRFFGIPGGQAGRTDAALARLGRAW